MADIEIEIVNWERYNPRKDIKRPHWFAFNNRMIEDSQFFSFTAEEFKAWIYILSQASQRSSGTVRLNLEHAERVCGIKRKSLIAAIEKLEQMQAVHRSVRVPNADVQNPNVTLHYKTLQNRTEQDIAPANADAENPVPVYCDFYRKKYGHNPVIGGKQSGILKRFQKNHPTKWRALIEGYLSMPDSWAVQRSHPVELLESKLNEIVRFLETGKVVTKKVVQHAEEMIDKAQGTSRRPRRSVDELNRERAEMLAEANVVPLIGGEK